MMRVLKKGLIRIIIFMMVISAPVHASNNQEYTNMLENTIITPYFTNISVFSSTLNISSYGAFKLAFPNGGLKFDLYDIERSSVRGGVTHYYYVRSIKNVKHLSVI